MSWPHGPRFVLSIVSGWPIDPRKTTRRLRTYPIPGLTVTVYDEAYHRGIKTFETGHGVSRENTLYRARLLAEELNAQERRDAASG